MSTAGIGGGDGDEGGLKGLVEEAVKGEGGCTGGKKEETSTEHGLGGRSREERIDGFGKRFHGVEGVVIDDGGGFRSCAIEELCHPVVNTGFLVEHDEWHIGKETNVTSRHLNIK